MTLTVNRVRKFGADQYQRIECEDTNGMKYHVRGKLPILDVGSILAVAKHRTCIDDEGWEFTELLEYELAVPLRHANAYRFLTQITGIGDATARKLLFMFGDDVISTLDSGFASSLEKASGRKGWENSERAYSEFPPQMRTMMLKFGVSAGMGTRIIEVYGDKAAQKTMENPYQLIDDVEGVGFLRADVIALASGNYNPRSDARVIAGITQVLKDAEKGGHTCLWVRDVQRKDDWGKDYIDPGCLTRTKKLLDLGDEADNQILGLMQSQKRFMYMMYPGGSGIEKRKDVGEVIMSRYNYECECAIAAKVAEMISMPMNKELGMDMLKAIESETGKTYDECQRKAIDECTKFGILAIGGKPGSGKTETCRAIVNAHGRLGKSVAIASPTGRGAKRFTEVTGYPASTIHRMLGYRGRGLWTFNSESPMDIDMVLIDEMSMVDHHLFRHLLDALNSSRTRLVIVGDPDQLPSVGVGDILLSMERSFNVPMRQMDEIYRQSGKSDIIVAARAIRTGAMPQIVGKDQYEFVDYAMEQGYDKSLHGETVLKILKRLLLAIKKDGYDLRSDVQVISTMYDGDGGIIEQNHWLQQLLNPSTEEAVEFGSYGYKPGDKIMRTKNDAPKNSYNGDIGWFKGYVKATDSALVEFDGETREYTRKEMGDIVMAWAISVHRSQGSEFPVVIFVMHGTRDMYMTDRRLIYTAVTRAQKKVKIISTTKAMQTALKKKKPRINLLMDLIIEACRKRIPEKVARLPESYVYETVPGSYRSENGLATGLYSNGVRFAVHNKGGIPTVRFKKNFKKGWNMYGMYDVVQKALKEANDQCWRMFGCQPKKIELCLPNEKRELSVPFAIVREKCISYKNYTHPAKWWVPEEYCEENGKIIGKKGVVK